MLNNNKVWFFLCLMLVMIPVYIFVYIGTLNAREGERKADAETARREEAAKATAAQTDPVHIDSSDEIDSADEIGFANESEANESQAFEAGSTDFKEEYLGRLNLGLLRAKPEPGISKAELINAVKPTIVRLRTGAHIGSGIIVWMEQDTLIIASNRHQLSADKYSTVTLFDGNRVSGIRSVVSSDYDLGFLEADISRLSYQDRMKLRSVYMIKDYLPAEDTPMFIAGSADGAVANIYEGRVADPMYYFPEFSSYMMYCDCKAKPGMSGGGAFDESGVCIGMVTGGIDNASAALPAMFIIEELEKQYPQLVSFE